MNSLQNSAAIASLIDRWLCEEQKGRRFPVDFDDAWKIAGYSTKQKAKNKLKYLVDRGEAPRCNFNSASG